MYAVQVFAEAEGGLERIVLSVDGEHYAEQSALGESELTFTIPWHATNLGAHTLEAVVYDSQHQVSEPVSVSVGVKARLVKKEQDFVYVPPAAESADDSSRGSVLAGGAGGQIMPVGDGAPVLGEPLTQMRLVSKLMCMIWMKARSFPR
ncbi:MAG: hypothetical protein Kow002_10450 [Anaerolineales bacterium]